MDVERTEVELLGGLDAVHLRHHAVAADAADVEAVQPDPREVRFDVDAGFELDEVGDVLDEAALDGRGVDDRHGAGRLLDRHGIERAADRDAVEVVLGIVGVALGLRRRRGGVCGLAWSGVVEVWANDGSGDRAANAARRNARVRAAARRRQCELMGGVFLSEAVLAQD